MCWVHIDTLDQLEAFYQSILPKLREEARACGYALGLHGSMRRDLDIIAAPWIEAHVDRDELARRVMLAACGIPMARFQWEAKPCGRMATSFPVCWTNHEMPRLPSLGHVDLSVMEASAR